METFLYRGANLHKSNLTIVPLSTHPAPLLPPFLPHCSDALLSLSPTGIFEWESQSTFGEWAATYFIHTLYIIYLKFLHRRDLYFIFDLLIYLATYLYQYTLWIFILYFYYNLILFYFLSLNCSLSLIRQFSVSSWACLNIFIDFIYLFIFAVQCFLVL